MNRILTLFIFIFLLVDGLSTYPFVNNIHADTSGTVTTTVKISVCGNGVLEGGEQCDDDDFGNATCSSAGNFNSGSLSCSPSCEFITTSCIYTAPVTPTAPSGGGGGGNYSPSVSPSSSASQTGVIFSGKAIPKSIITLLKDAQVLATTVSDGKADFEMTAYNVSAGNYNFSVYTEDNNGIRSSLHTFPVSVTSGVISKIGNIFIAPTIATDKSEVRKGDTVTIFGQSTPLSEVSIHVNSDNEFIIKKTTDISGAYLLNFDTSDLEIGQHNTKSKIAHDGEISSFSKVINFSVGTKNVFVPLPEKVLLKGDANGDRKINLVDFSVAAYWYNRPSPPKNIDLNGDGRVTLIDFSILAYNWTG